MTSIHPVWRLPVIVTALASFFAWIGYKLRATHLSNTMREEYRQLLKVRTENAARPCGSLLNSIEESKSIAEEALSSGMTPEDVRRALRDILARLSRAVDAPE